jgi:hypothetical protein
MKKASLAAVIRADLLRAAVDDADTRRKLDLALTWDDCVAVLADFAKKRGFKVVQL